MPSLIVNTNIPSINGQRHLGNTTGLLNRSLERLSSGLRINRAGDDPSGLAISETLNSHVRGNSQAVRNCNDGLSLIQTAEGTLDTYTSIIQRMRELAIQSSSDINSDTNRAYIQLEVDEMIEELNRIANTIDFNGAYLFDGSFINKRVQAGASAGLHLDISVGDARTQTIGAVAKQIGNAVDSNILNDGSILINGVEIGSSASFTARDKIIAINESSYETKVFASFESAQTVGGSAVSAGNMDLSNSLVINGITVPSDGALTVENNDASGSLRRAINKVSADTGVKANIDASGNLVLESLDDKPFTYTMNGSAVGITGLAGADGVQETVNGRIRLFSDQAFTVEDGTGSAADLIGIAAGPYAFDKNSSIDNVNVTSFDNAQEAIRILDNALRQVSDVRSGLGALTNRLENTVANLQVVSENLSASESRIRDADFAVETSNLTRAQILQESSVSVLAQANLTPQQALTLLQ